MTSKSTRWLIGFAIFLVIAAIGILVRINTTLPFLDRARFAHFVSHQAWTDLANELWAEPEIDSVQLLPSELGIQLGNYDQKFEVIAQDWDGSGDAIISLSPEKRDRYGELFSAAEIFLHMDRLEDRVLTEGGGADRFGRRFTVYLVSPRDGYDHAPACGGQYHRVEKGSCEVVLGPNWLQVYAWSSPNDQP